MSRENQIDEMAKAICEHYVKGGCGRCPDCFCEGDALKLYNAGYRKQEWISVEERLPDGNGRFLTVDKKGYMMVCYWEKRFGWFAAVCNKNAITHWMPLPPPPEKEKSNG